MLTHSLVGENSFCRLDEGQLFGGYYSLGVGWHPFSGASYILAALEDCCSWSPKATNNWRLQAKTECIGPQWQSVLIREVLPPTLLVPYSIDDDGHICMEKWEDNRSDRPFIELFTNTLPLTGRLIRYLLKGDWTIPQASHPPPLLLSSGGDRKGVLGISWGLWINK